MPDVHRLLPALLLLLPTAAGLGACRHTGYKEGRTEVVSDQRKTEVVVGDETLCERLEIRDLRKRRSGDQRLTVEFELLNKHTATVKAEATLVWYDAYGMRLVEEEPQALKLRSRERTTLRYTAPTPAADRWQLDLQRP